MAEKRELDKAAAEADQVEHIDLTGDAIRPVDASGGQRLNVTHCPSCDGEHEELEIRSYVQDHTPHTHWFICPRTGDPVSIGLWTTPDGLNVDLHRELAAGMVQAKVEGGAYMGVIFWIRPPGQLMIHRTTHEFPISAYPACVSELQRLLAEEAGEGLFEGQDRPATPEPAEGSKAKAPLLNLFGDKKPEA